MTTLGQSHARRLGFERCRSSFRSKPLRDALTLVLRIVCRDASEPAAMQHGVGEGFGYFVIVAHKKVASEAAC